MYSASASSQSRRTATAPTGRSPLVLLMGGYFAIYALVLLLGGARGDEVRVGIAHLPFPLLALAMVIQAQRATPDPKIARGWQWLGFGVACGLIGDLTWLESYVRKHEVATLAYLAWSLPYLGFSVAGLGAMMRAHRSEHHRWGDWLDASVMVVAAAMLAWYVVARNVTQLEMHDAETLGLFLLTTGTNFAILLLSLAVWLRGPAGLQRRAMGWYALAASINALADLFYERHEIMRTVVAGTWIDVCYAAVPFAIALAADAQRRAPVGPSKAEAVPAFASDSLPIAATGVALIPLLFESLKLDLAGNSLAGIAVGLVALTMLILVRQRLARAELDRLVASRVELEQQLWQSQKLEAVGRLAGGIAHDFNNILGAISTHSQLLRSAVPSALRGDVDEIEFATRRASSLTRRLLAFSRAGHSDVRPIPFGEVVRSMEPILRRLVIEEVTLAIRVLDGGVWVGLADGQLEQVLLNLAINARDAMPSGGRLEITTGSSTGSSSPGPGTWAVLTVRDEGTGMDERTKARLFEPFFTTKPRGRGTGLGLPTVDGIVRAAGGVIRVESAVGRGTTMTVMLPTVDAPAQHVPLAPPTEPAPEQPSSIATILLVDDERALRQGIARYLSKIGYQVEEADSVEQALEVLERLEWKLHLALTDIQMPERNGLELARELRARRGDVPVLYMSGFIDQRGTPGSPESQVPADDILVKPFDLTVLAARVRRALREAVVESGE